MGNTVEREEMSKQEAYNLEEAQPSSNDANFLTDMKEMKRGKPSTWKKGCTVCWLLTFGFIIFIVSLAVIGLSITGAVATNFYSEDMSGRLVALVILAVTAAIAITMTITGTVGLSKKKKHAMVAAATGMLVMAVIQAIILGVSVHISTDDEYHITNSLIDTYARARAKQPKYLDRWSATEHALRCCGVNGPEDYRTLNIPVYFAPDVTISCCDSYNPSLSDYAQEREREICKARKEYYAEGCKGDVILMFRDSANVITGVTVVLIILEIIFAILGIYYKTLHRPTKNETSRLSYHSQSDDKELKKEKEDKVKQDKKDDKKETSSKK